MTETRKESKYKPLVYFMTEGEIDKRFPTEKAAVDYFIKVRYEGNVTCHRCGNPASCRYKDRPKAFYCHHCRNTFSLFTGTIFSNSNLKLRKWYKAMAIFLNNRMGTSSLGIARHLGVTAETGWTVLDRLRIAMSNIEKNKKLEGTIEVDETYIGGKPRKQNALVKPDGTIIPRKYPKKNKRGRGTKKTALIGLKERDTGRVIMHIMIPDENGRKLTGRQVLEVIEKYCKKGSTIITDDFRSYGILDKKDSKYIHKTVNHSKGEYCNFLEKFIHTNGIENQWSIVKPALVSTYRNRQSFKYSLRYANEFAFRQSTRKNPHAFDLLLKHTILHDPSIAERTLMSFD